MKTFQVTIIEAVSSNAHMEISIEVEAESKEDAIEKAKPAHASKFGRTYVVKELKQP